MGPNSVWAKGGDIVIGALGAQFSKGGLPTAFAVVSGQKEELCRLRLHQIDSTTGETTHLDS